MEKMLNNRGEHIYPQKIYASQLITISDLLDFKKQFLDDLLVLLKLQQTVPTKKWMKSHEVRKMLKISPGTLQTLKSNGVIPYTKIGGVHFYDYGDIQEILENGKKNLNL